MADFEYDRRSIQTNAVDFMNREFPRDTGETDVNKHPSRSNHADVIGHTVETMKAIDRYRRNKDFRSWGGKGDVSVIRQLAK